MGKPETEVPSGTADLVLVTNSNIDEMRKFADQLFEAHYEEIALHKGSMKLDPNWHRYYVLEEQDAVVCLAAWLGEEMVGYSVSILYEHMHYKDVLVMHNDVLFVKKEHRRGGLGIKLIEATEEMAKARECHVVLFHSKVDTPLGLILEARGYGVQDVMQSKVL